MKEPFSINFSHTKKTSLQKHLDKKCIRYFTWTTSDNFINNYISVPYTIDST